MGEGVHGSPQPAPHAWVGTSLPRREDSRLVQGKGRFVGDLERFGLLHAAFVRSPHGAAEALEIDTSAALALDGVVAVYTAADLHDASLTALLERPEFVPTAMPLLARQARHAAEPVAVVIAEDPYTAEDGAEAVEVKWNVLPAITSMAAARAPGARRVHDALTDNCFVTLDMFEDDGMDAVLQDAAVVVDYTFYSGRVSALPMEGRACLAEWDDRDDQVVVHASTQVPHQVRTGIAQALDLPERSVRVIAPDVGGGFGLKAVVGREEVVVAAAAIRLRRPVRWVEDRQENLTASFHGHEQHYAVRAGFDRSGRILGLDAAISCDVGAYSAFPFTCAVEPLMACTELPGAYKVPRYRATGSAVATNKAPTAPYRGVSRPQIVLVMEQLIEHAARRLDLDPLEVRRRNLISPGDFPYSGPNGITYDEGSYRESLDRAESYVLENGWQQRREAIRAEGKLAGIGYACFSERTAYGTSTMAKRRMRVTPGFDVSQVRMDPSGDVVVTTGTANHGQGHETTFAQIVADRLGVHPSRVQLRQGDTDMTTYGWGTWGSRSVVIGGSAAHRAADGVALQLRKIAAHLLETSAEDVVLEQGRAHVRGDRSATLDIDELARLAHFQTQSLPEDCRFGLEARGTADPPGTFSNACHAVLAEIDQETGRVTLRQYLVVEDCGVMINPMVVEGQVRGGVAQGVAAALYERIRYDEDGQPVTATLMDYLVPTAQEMCPLDIVHLETRSLFSESGAKGMGEGGTIGAPGAVLSAVNDALAFTGRSFSHIPVFPEDVLDLLMDHSPGGSL